VLTLQFLQNEIREKESAEFWYCSVLAFTLKG
jgi:hypothetical protein